MSGASWRAWRVRAKASIAYGNGRRLCFWLRTAWRRGRLHAGWAVPPGRRANGGFAMGPTGFPGWGQHGTAGREKPGEPGGVPKPPPGPGRRIVAFLAAPPPAGHGRWTAPLIATALGDV